MYLNVLHLKYDHEVYLNVLHLRYSFLQLMMGTLEKRWRVGGEMRSDASFISVTKEQRGRSAGGACGSVTMHGGVCTVSVRALLSMAVMG